MVDEKVESILQENQRLRRAVEELSVLNEIATAVSSTLALEKIINMIVKKCVKHIHVQQAAVMLLEEQGKREQFHTMIRKVDSATNQLPYHLDAELTGWMLKNQTPLLVNDLRNDKRFSCVQREECPILSTLCVPLFAKGGIIGLLACFNKKGERFTPDDQRLLSIIASQSAQTIENARLLKKEQDLIRVEEEIRWALDIQLHLLPESAPVLKDYDIAAVSKPARIVGGDYYDFIHIENTRWAVCLGDISGKGLPAALLMANLQATIRAQTLIDPQPQVCMERSNRLLYNSTESMNYATLFYGILEAENHQFTYTNAGHNRPLYSPAGKESYFFKEAGIPLSFLRDFTYEQHMITFNPQDVLVIYSDGITEAMNHKEVEFGEQSLIATIDKNRQAPAETIIKKIVQATKEHAQAYPQSDDMTLVVIKRKK
jgi:sigma-B regulation protein RsbU (phosphoserine phosphatase)